jgi:hypothetical protein
MKTFTVLTIALTFLLLNIMMDLNPLGLAQVIFWGQRPPYHWVTDPQSNNWEYRGVNQKACASLYHEHMTGTGYRVYGYGFSESYKTINEAMARAEKECR